LLPARGSQPVEGTSPSKERQQVHWRIAAKDRILDCWYLPFCLLKPWNRPSLGSWKIRLVPARANMGGFVVIPKSLLFVCVPIISGLRVPTPTSGTSTWPRRRRCSHAIANTPFERHAGLVRDRGLDLFAGESASRTEICSATNGTANHSVRQTGDSRFAETNWTLPTIGCSPFPSPRLTQPAS
jgi:hypothetical protein